MPHGDTVDKWVNVYPLSGNSGRLIRAFSCIMPCVVDDQWYETSIWKVITPNVYIYIFHRQPKCLQVWHGHLDVSLHTWRFHSRPNALLTGSENKTSNQTIFSTVIMCIVFYMSQISYFMPRVYCLCKLAESACNQCSLSAPSNSWHSISPKLCAPYMWQQIMLGDFKYEKRWNIVRTNLG